MSTFDKRKLQVQTTGRKPMSLSAVDSTLPCSTLLDSPCVTHRSDYSIAALHQLDERGQEMADCARVWKIYNEEAAKCDTALAESCNRNIDVLLVFTGLFSAVLTTFVVQSYSNAAPSSESQENTNLLLMHLIQAQPNFDSAAFKKTLDSMESTPYKQAELTNGLWFAALACSLSAALVSMLAKQWLQGLAPASFGSPLSSARKRQSRFRQFQTWHVLTVINTLPVLLHVALLLFFAGLLILIQPLHVATTISTTIVVGSVYTFYIGSIWYSLVDPECPYQHPISAHLRTVFCREASRKRAEPTLLDRPRPAKFIDTLSPVLTRGALEHELDAGILAWMLHSPNPHVVTAALQAMSAIPRDFTAHGVRRLHEAGAVSALYREFKNCFQRDPSLGAVEWKVVDADNAELYCRALMRFGTRGLFHAEHIDEPLFKLITTTPDSEDGHNTPRDLDAVMTCLYAMSDLSSLPAQLHIVRCLQDFNLGKTHISQETEACLINSLTDCSFNWELSIAQIQHIKQSATPILLHRLFFHEAPSPIEPSIRNAITLALSAFTGGISRGYLLTPEEHQRESYVQLIIPALSAIIHNPSQYGVEDTLLNKTACQVARLASPVFAQGERFKPGLLSLLRHSLSKLLLDGRIGAENMAHDALADVLQMLYPPVTVSVGQHPLFVSVLLETLRACPNPGVVTATARLLDALLQECPLSVACRFIAEDGVNILTRAANAGATDSRQLQLDCLRPLFHLINSLSMHHTRIGGEGRHGQCQSLIVSFLNPASSSFFTSISAFLAAPRWWSPEVADIWLPALLKLHEIQPDYSEWPAVAAALHKFASNNESGSQTNGSLLAEIDKIRDVLEGSGYTPGDCVPGILRF